MNIKNKIAFATTLFPIDLSILFEFFNSLDNQTYKDFDLVILNDNFNDLNVARLKYPKINIVELEFSSTPSKNREHLINYIVDNKYDILIFGDCDDYFEYNRIEKSIELLKSYSIVINDVSLVNSNQIIKGKYFSENISDLTEINIDFIRQKNVMGLSNTAINLSTINRVEFDKELIAVDWYLFSNLLHQKKTAIFTNSTKTYYRQYDKNTAGLGNINLYVLKKEIEIKEKHYKLMSKIDSKYSILLQNLESFKTNFCRKNFEVKFIEKIKITNKYPLWWDLINLKES